MAEARGSEAVFLAGIDQNSTLERSRMQSQKLQCFDFNGAPVRVSEIDGQPWFVAADVCKVLEHSNSRQAIADLDEDEKGVSTADTLGGKQKVSIISESGLYALVFKSRKLEAKRFRRWVTSEVLPAIRKEGKYAEEPPDFTSADNLSGRLAQMRDVLFASMDGVVTGHLGIGKAQQVAHTARVILESIKIEGEALGYENLFELRRAEVTPGLLPSTGKRSGTELVQAVPQRGLHGTEAEQSDLQSTAAPSETELGTTQPAEETAAREPAAVAPHGYDDSRHPATNGTSAVAAQ